NFNGPWDFDTNDEGFRSGLYLQSSGNSAEITNWGEDENYDGLLSGIYKCVSNPGTLCACSGQSQSPPGPAGGCDDPACPTATCIGGGNQGLSCTSNANCPSGFC